MLPRNPAGRTDREAGMAVRTTAQAAKELGVNRMSLCQMLERMHAQKFGSQYVIDEDLFDESKVRRGKRGRPTKEKAE